MDADRTSPTGYDASFLDSNVPLPWPVAGSPVRELTYTHFTVLLHTDRRLAVATGVNIKGDQLVDVERADDWHLDPRVPDFEQTGAAVYAMNDLDRGHLVRRRDPVWGDAATSRQANNDTFAYTNAAPQAGEFNQSRALWLGLEDHVLTYAETNHNRVSVFTAPVLMTDDPPYRGVNIPQAFWKIAAWSTVADGVVILQAAGFVLDQKSQLAEIDLVKVRAQSLVDGTAPPLGPYRTYQVPIRDIADLTGLELTAMSKADVLASVPATRKKTDPREGWIQLTDASGIRLD